MIFGSPPFAAATRKKTIAKIMDYDDDLVFPDHVAVSSQCRQFIRSLLRCDTDTRLSAAEALQHQWIVQNEHTSGRMTRITGRRDIAEDNSFEFSSTSFS